MSDRKWAHREDCCIIRSNSDHSLRMHGSAVVVDCDGDKVFAVPDSFTDEQVWLCLAVANSAFADGYDQGEHGKAREIAKALYLD